MRSSFLQTTVTINILFFKLAVAVIGLEREVCVVDEGVGEMEVCVIVFRPNLDCPIIFPFDMIFYTTPGTAREYTSLSTICNICSMYTIYPSSARK